MFNDDNHRLVYDGPPLVITFSELHVGPVPSCFHVVYITTFFHFNMCNVGNHYRPLSSQVKGLVSSMSPRVLCRQIPLPREDRVQCYHVIIATVRCHITQMIDLFNRNNKKSNF